MTKYTKEQVSEACEYLLEITTVAANAARPKYLKDRPIQVHAVVRSVSKSGMSRRMDFFVLQNEECVRITHLLARLLGWSHDPDKGMRVDGCGMDMGFHTVYSACAAYERLTESKLALEPQVRYL